MPRHDRTGRKSTGVQCDLDKDIRKSTLRRLSKRNSSLLKRVIKTPGYRNLLRNTISVIPNQRERYSLNEDDKSKGIQTSFGNEIYLSNIQNKLFALTNQQRRTEPSLKSLTFLSERRKRETILQDEQDYDAAAPSTSLSHQDERQSFSGSREAPLTTLFRDDESGTSTSDNNPAFLTDTGNFAGSSRRSNQNDSTREDYLSYDVQNATGRQPTESLNLNERSPTKSRCCRKKRSSVSVSSRPIPIAIDDRLPKRESTISCRICHEGNEAEPLIQPCLCKGTVGNVHAKCLKNWLEQSNTSRCELCNYPYAIRQTKKYGKYISVKVFFRVVINKRSLIYDVVSFCVITPLAAAGIGVCVQASIGVISSESTPHSTVPMGSVTKAGMIMLSGTIIVAYSIWLFTLISSYYKSWKKWYDNCYDVEVIPVRMTSQDRREASSRILQERDRRTSREQAPRIFSIFQGQTVQPPNYHHRRMTISVVHNLPR